MKRFGKKKKYIFITILVILISGLIFLYFSVNGASSAGGIDKFPSDYQPYLRELAKKHPNWKFIPLYTGLDWNYVIKEENVFGKNLVPLNYSDSWKNTTPGQYNVEVDAGWVDSSKQAVEYCMDPRNFLNEVRLFQFEGLSYDEHTNDLLAIEKILYGTEFYQKQVSYFDSNGNNISMSERYSDLILKAAKTSSVSSYHLASRIKQEVGPFLTHGSISGTVSGFEGLYNFYNIGATSSAEPMGAIKNGLRYARDGKGANESTKRKYLIPWNNKDKAISGGGIFIGSSYINVGQNTVYLQKFDVIDTNGDGLFWHQYMTNVLAPYSESKSIYNGYQKVGMLDSSISFIIPIYNNMPTIPADSPNINKNDFVQDNSKVMCNANTVNIRTGPSTSYEIITTVPIQAKMTRILKGKQSGDKWDKVILENGIIGYISQKYVSEVLENTENELNWADSEVTGLNYKANSVSNLKKEIEAELAANSATNIDVEIVNLNDKVLNESDLVGTGCKVRFKQNGSVLKEYNVILYGDSNGDGKINSVDLLVLQRHILEIQKLDDIFVKASNVRKNGNKPTSVDLLLIQRHILGLQIIEQFVDRVDSAQSLDIVDDAQLIDNAKLVEAAQNDGTILEAKNTNLETLAIENALFNVPFDNSITNYSTEVSHNITKLNILAIPENENAKSEIFGNENIVDGNNKITIIVTSQDGLVKREFTIDVYRRNVQQEIDYENEQIKKIEKLRKAYEIGS